MPDMSQKCSRLISLLPYFICRKGAFVPSKLTFNCWLDKIQKWSKYSSKAYCFIIYYIKIVFFSENIDVINISEYTLGYEPAGLTMHPLLQSDRGWAHYFRIGVRFYKHHEYHPEECMQ